MNRVSPQIAAQPPRDTPKPKAPAPGTQLLLVSQFKGGCHPIPGPCSYPATTRSQKLLCSCPHFPGGVSASPNILEKKQPNPGGVEHPQLHPAPWVRGPRQSQGPLPAPKRCLPRAERRSRITFRRPWPARLPSRPPQPSSPCQHRSLHGPPPPSLAPAPLRDPLLPRQSK